MNKQFAIFLFAFFVSIGCLQGGNTDIKADAFPVLEEPFKLMVNQNAYIKSENLLITFVGVPEDSRCPSDVVCIWAGQTTIELRIEKPSKDIAFFTTLNITKGGEQNSSASFADYGGNNYTIKLLSVEPYPQTADTKRNYEITLSVSKTS